jgi:hypothetical protein
MTFPHCTVCEDRKVVDGEPCPACTEAREVPESDPRMPVITAHDLRLVTAAIFTVAEEAENDVTRGELRARVEASLASAKAAGANGDACEFARVLLSVALGCRP